MRKSLTRARVLAGSAVVTITLAPSFALAALDETALDAAVTGITADANTAFTKAFPILTLVLGLVIGMTLFKKFINKAAS